MGMSRSFRLRVVVVALLVFAALPCFASEVAVLKNGFSIRHERRVVIGDITRLYTTADGASYVDVPTAEIEHFEAAPDVPASGVDANSLPFARNTRVGSTASVFPGSSSVDLNEVVNNASGRYRLDPDLVNSVIKAESGFNVRAVSPKGARGLMQLMPGTASQLGVPNAFDPEANVEGGTKYLRELLERYNFDLVKALAAYNAGPQRVERFGGVPPYFETRAYVARVVKDFNKKKVAQERAAAAAQKATAKATSAKTHASGAQAHSSVPGAQAKARATPPRE